jgi:hypothetical protein
VALVLHKALTTLVALVVLVVLAVVELGISLAVLLVQAARHLHLVKVMLAVQEIKVEAAQAAVALVQQAHQVLATHFLTE